MPNPRDNITGTFEPIFNIKDFFLLQFSIFYLGCLNLVQQSLFDNILC